MAKRDVRTNLAHAAKILGGKGGRKGGPARANALTATERSAIASKGGKAKEAQHGGRKKGPAE